MIIKEEEEYREGEMIIIIMVLCVYLSILIPY